MGRKFRASLYCVCYSTLRNYSLHYFDEELHVPPKLLVHVLTFKKTRYRVAQPTSADANETNFASPCMQISCARKSRLRNPKRLVTLGNTCFAGNTWSLLTTLTGPLPVSAPAARARKGIRLHYRWPGPELTRTIIARSHAQRRAARVAPDTQRRRRAIAFHARAKHLRWTRTRASQIQWQHAVDRYRATHCALPTRLPSYADYILRLQDADPESLEIMLRLLLVALPLVVALPAVFDKQEANTIQFDALSPLQFEVRSPPKSRPVRPAATH